jgi:hypothetical protein
MAETDSILDSIKKMLGLESSFTAYDIDITIHINSVFSTLHQLGVGPTSPFKIVDKNDTWVGFIGNVLSIDSVKTYMYMKVRLIFDPPTNSFTIDAYKQQISEFEFRLKTAMEEANSPTYVPPVVVPSPVPASLPTIWDLTGLTDFPANAPYNAVGLDTATLLIYRNR